jgi:enoyl-CoA hydratase/carnithine racemase
VTGASSNEPVLMEADVDGVRLLTLNRPEQRNSLNTELAAALFAALEIANADAAVRVVVLTGADPAFCAGIDLKEASLGGADFFRHLDSRCVTYVGKMSKPIIGAINGAAITGGFEIALGCDFLIASERAVFADTHARVGILPGGGMTARLPGAVGLRQAKLLSMTGNLIDARRAERLGLVAEVVPHQELVDRALEIARTIGEIDPVVIGSIKRMYAEGSETTLGGALELERAIAGAAGADFSKLGARRDAVMKRNRSQLT